MPPVAKAVAVNPAGDRERELYELVDAKFGNNAEFFRKVAKRTGKAEDTEKSAYYRIIRGKEGSRMKWRLGHYAAVLQIPPKPFVAAWEEDEEAADVTVLPLNPTPRELRNALLAVIDRVDRLAGQVEDLVRPAQPKRRKEGSG